MKLRIRLNKQFFYALLVVVCICFGYYPFLFLLIGVLTIYTLFFCKITIDRSFIQYAWIWILVLWFICSIYSLDFIRGIKYSITLLCLIIISLYLKQDILVQNKLFNILYCIANVHVFFILIRQLFPDLINRISYIILTSSMYQSQIHFIQLGYWNGNVGITIQSAWAAFFCVIQIGIAYIYYKENKELYHLFLMLLGFCALLLTNKRGPLIAMIFSLTLLIFLLRSKKFSQKNMLKKLIYFILIIIILNFLLRYIPGITKIFQKISNMSNMSIANASSGRMDIYKSIINYMAPMRYFIGYGTGTTDTVFGINAHNVYLQLLFENGFVTLMLFMSVAIYSVYFTYKKIVLLKSINQNINILCFSLYFQSFFLLYGISGNPLYDTPILFLYLIVVFSADVFIRYHIN